MGEMAKGILAVWTDVHPAGEAEFSAWYNREHLRERVEIPGFLNARRYRAISGAPRYFAAYDTESPAVLGSGAYLHALAHQTEWSKRVFRSFQGTVRLVGELLGEAGSGCGGYLLAVRCKARPGHKESLRLALAGGLAERLAEEPEVVRVCVVAGEVAALSEFPADRASGAAEDPATFAVLVEGSDGEALEALRHEALSDQRLTADGGASPVHSALYALQYALVR